MEEEDTVEFIDLLRVVWKWKRFIVMSAIACGIAAGTISFLMPKIYEFSMIIEPVVIDIDLNGRPIYFESPLNIKSKIDSGAYNGKIFKRLNADPKKLNLKFNAIHPGNSNTIKVILELKDINTGINALLALFEELVEEYQNYINSRKSELDQQIAMNKRQLNVSESEKKYLEKEISMAKANTNRIIEERNNLISKGSNKVDKLSLLIYTNIIQQNMAHYNNLNEQLSKLMGEAERIKSTMEALKIKKQSIESVKLIQTPHSSIYPIKPKKKLNIILAFVAGFFISILVSFFLEYLHKKGIHFKSTTTPA